MKRHLFAAGLLAAGLFLSAPPALSNTAATPDTGRIEGISIDLGRRDYGTYCAACHGVAGKGDGTVAEFLTINAPDLTQLAKRNAGMFPRERLREVIDGRAEVRVHGSRDMPVWGDWFDREAISPDTDRDTRAIIVRDRIESLVDFIAAIQQN